VTKWRLVERRGHTVVKLKATFNGEKAKVTKTRTKGGRRMFVVRIDMRGLSKGLYNARVRYQLAEARTKFPRSKVHLYRACGGKDSLNARSIITI
jgi:hypothetical protein